ncbi:T9SS type A sorting domain-containing protein [bacterium]|nr:T9SS type A sorting domain-containing protein [bacterium]
MKKIILFVILLVIYKIGFGLIHLDINGYTATNALNPLDIESYIADNDEVVHPDVIYIENGWNGYEYWMVFTPFPNSEPQFENPSIVASHDGINWELPQGLTNPIITPYDESFNSNNYYHSDPDLIMSEDNSTMYVFWRDHAGWRYEKLKYVYSTDGINWSLTQEVFSVDGNIERILSPAIVRDSISYKMWTVDTKTNPRTIRMRTSNDPTASWSPAIATDLSLITPNTAIWHLDVTYIEGKYYMLASVGVATEPRGGKLYLALSNNGINWEVAANPVLEGVSTSWDRLIYRSSILLAPVEDYVNFKVWYSSDGGTPSDNLFWKIGYTEFNHEDIPEDETLPVQLSSFSTSNYQNGKIKIQWISESESNLNGYRLYRNNTNSLENSEMLEVFISASNSSQTQHYSYIDESIQNNGLYYYWIKMIDYDGSSSYYGPSFIEIDNDNLDNTIVPPVITGFTSIYPNPSNPTTTLSYSLESKSQVTIEIFNLKGQLVKLFDLGIKEQGHHKIVWNGLSDNDVRLPSGIYFSRMKTPDTFDIKKIILMK